MICRSVSLAVATALAFTAAPAIAAEKSSDPSAAQTEMITPNRAFELFNALVAITGAHDELAGQGASQHTVAVSYDLSGDTLWALTDDINILQNFVKEVQTVARAMRSKAETDNGGPWPGECELPISNPAALAPSDPKCVAFHGLVKQIAEFNDKARPINKLFRITRKDLKLGAPNRIAGGLLASIVCEQPPSGGCIVQP